MTIYDRKGRWPLLARVHQDVYIKLEFVFWITAWEIETGAELCLVSL